MARLGLKGLLVLLGRLGAGRSGNGTETMKDHNKEVSRIYEEAQLVPNEPVATTLDDLSGMSSAWKDPGVAELQARVSRFQVSQFEKGIVDPVFIEFIASVNQIRDEIRSLLDLACGGGYYGKILSIVAPEVIYHGCDYSSAMVDNARLNYPGLRFDVADATQTGLADRSSDAVMLSGALEHIPDYNRAIDELCRLANKYIILHRLPLTKRREPAFTKGAQYNIETPRIYFPKPLIESAFQARGFAVARCRPTYTHNRNVLTYLFVRS